MSSTTINAHFDSTIESLGKGLKAAKTGATRSINSWIETLNSEGMEDIAKELTSLKELLASDDIDAAKLKKSLKSLGTHTTKAASEAEGATADKIKKLGKTLTDAAGSL